jgi:glycerol-3-phosphate acyltransferase PlsX
MADNTLKNTTYKIAIDAMGGDFAPKSEIEGVIRVFEQNYSKEKLEIVFVGIESVIIENLKKYDVSKINYSIINADEVVTMHDDATSAIKNKKNSSLYIGAELHKSGKVDAFISAGNTGAMMSTCTVLLGRIKGVSRPTIGTFFPTVSGKPTLIVDAGANVDSKPKFLTEFAVMGSIYFSEMLGVEKPKVGLLNIGEEKSKGNEIVVETYSLLSESKLNFIGNIEGGDIFNGKADVVVCDGFTGNIVLKFAESFLGFLKQSIKNFADKSLVNKIQVGLMVPTLKKVLSQFDYQDYGGVPLLGVNGVAIIGHGKSTPKAIQNMILRSIEIIDKDINNKIGLALSETNNKTTN